MFVLVIIMVVLASAPLYISTYGAWALPGGPQPTSIKDITLRPEMCHSDLVSLLCQIMKALQALSPTMKVIYFEYFATRNH